MQEDTVALPQEVIDEGLSLACRWIHDGVQELYEYNACAPGDIQQGFRRSGSTVVEALEALGGSNTLGTRVTDIHEGPWSVQGAGSFAVVLRHDEYPDVVLKVSCIDEDLGPVYWAYAQAHADNPAVPRIYQRGRDAKLNARWAVSERLYVLDDIYPVTGTVGKAFAWLRTDPDAQAVQEDMRKLAKLDLHPGNIMQRYPTEQFVLNDPVSVTDTDRARWIDRQTL